MPPCRSRTCSAMCAARPSARRASLRTTVSMASFTTSSKRDMWTPACSGWRRDMASSQAAVADDQALEGSDELRGLIATGTERGYLTFEEIASTLEEVEVTKEQVTELHSHLVEQGVDVIAADGVTAYKE